MYILSRLNDSQLLTKRINQFLYEVQLLWTTIIDAGSNERDVINQTVNKTANR